MQADKSYLQSDLWSDDIPKKAPSIHLRFPVGKQTFAGTTGIPLREPQP